MQFIKKYIPILASVLCSVFMFSVGFSSWLIITGESIEPSSGGFVAYDVNEYVVAENAPTVFNYTSIYFVESDREEYTLGSQNTGYITVVYDFTDEAKALMTESGGLTLVFNLWYQDARADEGGGQPKMFKDTNTKATLSTSSAEYKPSEPTDSFSFSHTFKVGALQDAPASVTVTYTLTTTVGQGFRADFGQYLLNNKNGLTTKFFTSAKAEVTK